MLDGLTITAVDVNEDRKILCKKVNEGSIHLKKNVEKCVVLSVNETQRSNTSELS